MRLLALLPFVVACASGGGGKNGSDTSDDGGGDGCSETEDADGDGLDDCAELEWGTDGARADSDADGTTDGAEVTCGSDPLDQAEVCYTCGWKHGDPGDLGAVGPEVGDTIENLALFDQCEEAVDLWDLAEEYHILFITAAW